MNKAALLIGISEYNSESSLKPLPSAAEDVQAMRHVLLKSSEFTAENITVLTNSKKDEVEDAIYRLFADRRKEDLLLFYFSGHGIKDVTGKLYFSLPTTRMAQNGSLIKHTAIPATVLHESMNDSQSTCQVLVLDCCFSGAFAKGLTIKDDNSIDVRTQLGGKGRAIFTSSKSTEHSFHQNSLRLSVYTHFFVEGLEKGAADLDSDGLISADELHTYISEEVRQFAPKMTPQFFPVEQGHKIYLARSARHASDKDIPHERDTTGRRPNPRQVNKPGKLESTCTSEEDELSSEQFGVNYYVKLRDLLKDGKWKEADRETNDCIRCMREVMDRQNEGCLEVEEIKKFPCQDLKNIDRLWVKYSNGKFGFSVQKKIWQECGSPMENNDDWKKFGDRVGWCKDGNLLEYDSLTFNLKKAPKGKLPAVGPYFSCLIGRNQPVIALVAHRFLARYQVGEILSRVETCKL